MVDASSRYYRVGEATWSAPNGDRIVYKLRRLPPEGSTLPLQVMVTVGPGERLDVIADRTLGNGQLFWRIADANDAMNPFELTRRSTLRIPAIRA